MVRFGKREHFASFLDKVLADTSPRFFFLNGFIKKMHYSLVWSHGHGVNFIFKDYCVLYPIYC